jgi:uncharacterized protein
MTTLPSTIIEELRTQLLPAQSFTDGAHGLDHFYRVADTAQIIANGQGDRQAIEIACLLHDIVNYPKNHPDRKKSAEKSAEYAVNFLRHRECDPALIDQVHEAILCHSYSGGLKPKSWEAQCVQDADRVDAVGAIGIARTFYVCGSMGGSMMHPDDPLGYSRELDDSRYCLDHFQIKLGQLQYLMNTPLARSMARKRSVLMEAFRHQFAANDPVAREMGAYFYERGRQGVSLYSPDDAPVTRTNTNTNNNPYFKRFLEEVKISGTGSGVN